MTNHVYIYSAGNLAVLRVLLDAGGDLQAGRKLAFKGRGKWASEAKKRKKITNLANQILAPRELPNVE